MATGMEPRNTVLFQGSGGRYWVMNTRTKKLTRVAKADRDEARRIWGAPIRRRGDLPQSVKIGGKQNQPPAVHLLLRVHGGKVNRKDLRGLFGSGPVGIERYIAGRKRDPFTGSKNFNPNPGRAREGDRIFAPSMFRGNDAMGFVRSLLSPYDLDTPQVRRLVDGLIETGASTEEIFVQLRETDEWKQRFKGNVERRKAGLPELSPDQYVQTEEQLREILTSADVPAGFRDSNDDFAAWIGSGMSPQLLAERVNRGIRQVNSASPEVREAFEELVPGEGHKAMMAFMLDPDRATSFLEKKVMQATAEGVFARNDLNIFNPVRDEAAQRAQEMGMSIEEFQQSVAQSEQFVGEREALFRETVGESAGTGDVDLKAGVEGAQASLLGDFEAGREIERRRQSRLSTQGGAGGATGTDTGLSF